MSTFIKTIKSFNQNGTSDTIYPITKADAVYLSDDNDTESHIFAAENNIDNLNTKVGTANLNTTAQNLCAAINQHEADISGLNNNYENNTVKDIVFRYVTITVPSGTGATSVDITAPSVSGYTFLTWYTATPSGWVAPLSFQNPGGSSTKLWKPATSSNVGGTASAYALYVKN